MKIRGMFFASTLAVGLLGAAVVSAQEPSAVPNPVRAEDPAANEAIAFADPLFQGPAMRLKVGDELSDLRKTAAGNWAERISSLKVGSDAIVVLYSWFNFGHVCLGLPGTGSGGSGRFADLSRIKSKDLPIGFDNNSRSLRVVAKGTNLRKICH
ncbi:MAG: hypothetical protein ACM3O7_07845 [Acidobacteriota bacterium]